MAAYKKSAEMRRHILDATKQLIPENGYGQTAIKDIADHLGVPRSLIYYYFENKKSILKALYQESFQEVDRIASEVLPRGEEPLVRLMLKYLIFRKTMVQNPLFTEFIVDSEFAALDMAEAANQVEEYYSDSRDAFAYCGRPVDGKDFLTHVHMIEGVGRAMVVGEYYKTLSLTDREAIGYLGKYAVIPTFELTNQQFEAILDRTFELAGQIEGLNVNQAVD